jgi:hypothetical protein
MSLNYERTSEGKKKQGTAISHSKSSDMVSMHIVNGVVSFGS